MSKTEKTCAVCKKIPKKLLMCKCKMAYYCSRECQVKDWKNHQSQHDRYILEMQSKSSNRKASDVADANAVDKIDLLNMLRDYEDIIEKKDKTIRELGGELQRLERRRFKDQPVAQQVVENKNKVLTRELDELRNDNTGLKNMLREMLDILKHRKMFLMFGCFLDYLHEEYTKEEEDLHDKKWMERIGVPKEKVEGFDKHINECFDLCLQYRNPFQVCGFESKKKFIYNEEEISSVDQFKEHGIVQYNDLIQSYFDEKGKETFEKVIEEYVNRRIEANENKKKE